MNSKFLILTIIFLSFCLNVKAQYKEIFSDVQTVSYCELVNNAEKYDQQFLRVKATYSSGFESSIFFDDSCSDNKVSWATFVSAYEQNTKSVVLNKLNKLFKRSSQKKHREIEMLIVGKFDGKRQVSTLKTPAKTFTFSMGYGHMNAFDYQLTVLKVEKIKLLKN